MEFYFNIGSNLLLTFFKLMAKGNNAQKKELKKPKQNKKKK